MRPEYRQTVTREANIRPAADPGGRTTASRRVHCRPQVRQSALHRKSQLLEGAGPGRLVRTVPGAG